VSPSKSRRSNRVCYLDVADGRIETPGDRASASANNGTGKSTICTGRKRRPRHVA